MKILNIFKTLLKEDIAQGPKTEDQGPEMSGPQNVRAPEMSEPQNVRAQKCPSPEMSEPQNVRAQKCPSPEMSEPQNSSFFTKIHF